MAKLTPGQDAGEDLLNNWKRVQKEILPEVLANEAKEAFIENFNQEGFFGKGWKAPNRAGRERPSLPTLEQSGDLRGGVEILKAEFNNIQVGVVGIEYAEIHNEGGDIPVTPLSRRYFMAKFRATKKPFWRNMALNTKGKVEIPQRQFIGSHPKLTAILVKTIENELKRLSK